MLKRYTFWLSAACLFQLAAAAIHAVSFFVSPRLTNDTELQLHQLITTYHADMGAGFTPTFYNLFTAMSICFSLLCVLSSLTNGYLLFKQAEPHLMKGILAINVGVFGICFLVMAVFTFLPPIILTGLIFFNLLAAFVVVPKIQADVDLY